MDNKPLIFGCPGSVSVAKAIREQIDNGGDNQVRIKEFSEGELKFILTQSVRGKDCWVVQVFNRGHGRDVLQQFYQAKALMRTLKDCHAASVNFAMPYLPNTRQEQLWGREGYLFKMIVDEILTLGVRDIITFDLHNGATASLFDGRCTHLFASHIFIPTLRKIYTKFDTVCSADTGAAKMAEYYALKFECDLAVLAKGCYRTPEGREIKGHKLAGDVRGKKILLVDELCDTGGTLVSGINFLIDECGAAQVIPTIVHTVGAGKCREKLVEVCKRPEVINYHTSDSVIQPEGFYEGITINGIISLTPTIAETIKNIHSHQSVGGAYLVPV